MILVVGGQCADVGKTGVISGLIASLPEVKWCAIKVGLESHGVGHLTTEPFYLQREQVANSRTDSGIYLAAGAHCAYTLHLRGDDPSVALPAIKSVISENPHIVLESNSIVPYIHPHLYLYVVDSTIDRWGKRAKSTISCANAFVLIEREVPSRFSTKVPIVNSGSCPVFTVNPVTYTSASLVQFVRQHLQSSS